MNDIQAFLEAQSFAVAGASQDPTKYGNKIFRTLLASGRTVFPLNPKATEIDGQVAYSTIAEVPVVVQSLSIVTPPTVTQVVVQEAITAGVKNIWMQPGAENPQASQLARDAGLNVIDDGSCILVQLSLERSKTRK